MSAPTAEPLGGPSRAEPGDLAGDDIGLDEIERCFGGAIPVVIATASPTGVANVCYLSQVHRIDDERIAVSNQFMSKSARNLVANPRADLLIMDPVTYDEYRVAIVYERTERRGPVFERMRSDLDALAAISGMQDVFTLRSADIFRVVGIHRHVPHPSGTADDADDRHGPDGVDGPRSARELAELAELAAALSRAPDLDTVLDTALCELDRRFGYRHLQFLVLDASGRTLTVIASHGYETDGVGAEEAVGVGPVGAAALRCEPVRAGNLVQFAKYTRSVGSSYAVTGIGPGREIPAPDLPGVNSRIAVPARCSGELIGVLAVDSTEPTAFTRNDEHVLGVVASIIAGAVEHDRLLDIVPADPPPPEGVGPSGTSRPQDSGAPVDPGPLPESGTGGVTTTVRFFEVDGSVFLGTDYLIKGVAGRILWTLVRQHLADGRVDFTNRELRLDPSLDLPGFKDNLESRLVLLKRRLVERDAPIRIDKTGRGRFRLCVTGALRAEAAD